MDLGAISVSATYRDNSASRQSTGSASGLAKCRSEHRVNVGCNGEEEEEEEE